jgi:hypothetical protein
MEAMRISSRRAPIFWRGLVTAENEQGGTENSDFIAYAEFIFKTVSRGEGCVESCNHYNHSMSHSLGLGYS